MLMLQILLSLLFFIIISFFTFYVVGFAILSINKKGLEDWEVIPLSLALGLVIFVISASIFGLLNLRFLTLPLILLINIYVLVKYKFKVINYWKIFLKDKILSLLILLGILVQGFINFPSGISYQDGLMFWSSQGHDGIWHIALMEEIKNNFPPQNPIFAGERLYNYHYLVDVLMGEFYRIFQFFSSLDLYFRFFPIIFSFLIGTSVFAFVRRWQNNLSIAHLSIFFTYFVGSFGYIVSYIKGGSIFAGETTFWAAQVNTILGNPPHAISITFMTSFFLSFLFFVKERSKFWFLISCLLALSLAGFKVSAGMTLLMGLGAAALVDLLFHKRFSTLILFIILLASNFVVIKSMTRGVESFLMFLPWWFIRTMVVVKLDWIDLELRRQHYLAQGTWHANLRVVQLELQAFVIFLIGNLGMRFLGFYEIGRKLLKERLNFFKDPFEVLLFVTMWTGFVVPMLFVQKGIIYNNIQFMQYFLLIFGFFAAISFYRLVHHIKNKAFRVLIFTLLICLSAPTVIGNLVEFYSRPPLAKITNEELEALNFLKNNSKKEEVVLNAPFNKNLNSKFDKQPWPIYVWYSTAYIPALTGLRTYLSSEEQALITGYPIEERLNKVKIFFQDKDPEIKREFLKENKIDYIYLAKEEIETPFTNGLDLQVFFENKESIIYKVRK